MSKLNREQYLLTVVSEEASEVAEEASKLVKRITKAIRFGLEEIQEGQQLDNNQRIGVVVMAMVTELNDLIGAMEMLGFDTEKLFQDFNYRPQVEAKKERIEKYMKLSKSRGIV
jgi:hypothetical protein